jgi:hypothetical protein
MRVYRNMETALKYKNDVIKRIKERLEHLKNRKKLFGSMKQEIELYPVVLEKIESGWTPDNEIDFWLNQPGTGLEEEWGKKIIES